MEHFVIFSLFLLGFCAVSFAAPKDVPWVNSFVHPALNRPNLGVTGGQVASPNQFPYQVGMFSHLPVGVMFCGGVLISPSYVLTAAHCVETARFVNVFFGAHNVSEDNHDEATRQDSVSSNYVIHPDWDRSILSNDLAIIELDEPITLNEYVQVIKIAEGDETYAGKQGTATGWGKTADKEPRSDLLRYVNNRILSNAECKATSPEYDSVVKDTNVCFSGKGLKGVCKGDSGGPLVSNGVVVGVTSFCKNPCESGNPSVFTRVSKYADWIKENSDL